MTLESAFYYQILEIEPGASQEDIKQAYRDLAKVWHPDRFSDDPRLQKKAEEKIKRINVAYEMLIAYHAQSTQNSIPGEPKSVQVTLNCSALEQFLQSGQLQAADRETKQLLLELAGRKKDGWLRSDDVHGLPTNGLATIDHLWTQFSQGRFGWSVQRRIWHHLGCTSSANTTTQTMSENRFGQALHWRTGSLWLSPWDSFSYTMESPLGSLPKDYIFALSGWWSYSKGWTGYLLWRFDELFLKL